MFLHPNKFIFVPVNVIKLPIRINPNDSFLANRKNSIVILFLITSDYFARIFR